jgi:acyl-CoA synthetase (AMP-forming)/AMP-acid ligase II
MSSGSSFAGLSIPALVQVAAERYGDAEAIADLGPDGGSDPGRRRTFAELAAEVRQCAAAGIAAGVSPGDRVGIWAPNCLEWVVAALGLLSAGATVVPLNTRLRGEEAADILDRTEATLLVVADGFLGASYTGMLRAARPDGAGALVPGLPSLRTLVDVGPVTAASGAVGQDVLRWSDFVTLGGTVSAAAVDERINAVKPDDVCDLMFTSGTTGRPKGVPATHAQSLRAFATWSEVAGLVAGDRYLIVNPFFHTFGYKAGVLACLMRGATILPQPVFDTAAVARRIAEERATVLPGPPTIYSSLLDDPSLSGYDLSSLRIAVTGAAMVPVVLIERMFAELTLETVLTAYGLTEATGVVTMCRRGDDPTTIATTCGRAIPDTELAIMDKDGQILPPGETGEVVCRGYNVMSGYLDDPAATAETIDADGWLHTGDVGHLDERGNLTITDRLKDMYTVGGFNAYPAEIEQVLARHPAVGEVAVIGVPDARMGEVGAAYIVVPQGRSLDSDELIAWARERMANYKVPRTVTVVEALPRNASGKVVKGDLRSLAGQ